MKYSFYIIFAFLFNFGFVTSQGIVIKGNISDSLNTPIEYSSIGVLNRDVGTVSDKAGDFILKIKESMIKDTLRISCVGYKPIELLIKEILKNQHSLSINLENFIEELDEVILTSKKTKTYESGKLRIKTKVKVIFSKTELENKKLGTEIGRKFKLGNKKVSSLSEFKFFIKENNYEYSIFRINIYSIKRNMPNRRINKESILVKVGKNYSDWVVTDLSPYDINVRENIIITVEWIECSEKGNKLSLPIIIPSLGSNHYYKFGSQNSWAKFENISTPMYLKYEK